VVPFVDGGDGVEGVKAELAAEKAENAAANEKHEEENRGLRERQKETEKARKASEEELSQSRAKVVDVESDLAASRLELSEIVDEKEGVEEELSQSRAKVVELEGDKTVLNARNRELCVIAARSRFETSCAKGDILRGYRVRPFTDADKRKCVDPAVAEVSEDGIAVCTNGSVWNSYRGCDYLWSERVSKQEIFDQVEPLLLAPIQGGSNAAIICYGQSGAGKCGGFS